MNCLVMFAKYPEMGKVKTRLSKDIGEEKAGVGGEEVELTAGAHGGVIERSAANRIDPGRPLCGPLFDIAAEIVGVATQLPLREAGGHTARGQHHVLVSSSAGIAVKVFAIAGICLVDLAVGLVGPLALVGRPLVDRDEVGVGSDDQSVDDKSILPHVDADGVIASSGNVKADNPIFVVVAVHPVP